MASRRSPTTLAHMAVALAIAAILLRSALTFGPMPSVSGGTGSPIVICTLAGAAIVYIDQLGRRLPQSGDHGYGEKSHASCHFGLSGSLGLPNPRGLVARHFVEMQAPSKILEKRVTAADAALPWHSRAPPQYAYTGIEVLAQRPTMPSKAATSSC